MSKFNVLLEELDLTLISGTTPEEFEGVYAGDLLSRAMSRVEEGNIWITIMSNVNVIAVASLTEVAAVILAEGVRLPDDVKAAAEEKGISVYSSDMTAYELCAKISSLS